MELHPQYISRGGREEYVVLPAEEFRALEAILADYHDLTVLREAKAKERSAGTISLDAILSELAGKDA